MPVELEIIRASEFILLNPQERLDLEASKNALRALAQACRKPSWICEACPSCPGRSSRQPSWPLSSAPSARRVSRGSNAWPSSTETTLMAAFGTLSSSAACADCRSRLSPNSKPRWNGYRRTRKAGSKANKERSRFRLPNASRNLRYCRSASAVEPPARAGPSRLEEPLEIREQLPTRQGLGSVGRPGCRAESIKILHLRAGSRGGSIGRLEVV